ncbi:hypothetical protein GCU67_13275 [Modestobacter muralis]|uniref:GerMN domain-containing protein n=1 Tax=Modestobacter muralis TaxID=1608614 RepID=A0A6P0EW86_9ACTN|nr:hypothetical protein [Modestobacter muralis]NEK95133.1 hypothetical protein [Modestobacter muralis]NEN52021.1 hypothetical protein [Modestobacter muralis]
MAVLRVLTGGAAVIAVLAVSSCSSSSPDSSATAPSTTSSAPTASTSGAVADPTQSAEAQAVALVATYTETIDDLYLDPARSLDDLYDVSIAPEATAEATAIGTFRSQGYRQAGRSQLVTASAGEVDLTNDPAASPSPVYPSVVVTACVDVSQVQATDSTGNPIVPSDRPRYLIEQLTVVNIDYPDASSWRVSQAPNRQAQSCDG